MEHYRDYIKQLLLKYSKGTASPEEKEALLHFLSTSSGADLDMMPEVEEVVGQADLLRMESGEAESIFNRVLWEVPIPGSVTRPWYSKGLRIAAIILPIIILGSLGWIFLNKKPRYEIYENKTTTVKTISLNDGTMLHLNQNSSVKVLHGFNEAPKREVWMEGEVFFEVLHRVDKPFLVHTGKDWQVEVLGTTFNVNARGTRPTVVLNSGAVNVHAGHEKVTLLPGEMAYLDDRGQLKNRNVDTLYYTSWKHNLASFQAAKLQQVLDTLASKYGLTYALDDELIGQQLFTGYLPTNNLGDAIATLEQTFNLKITFRDNQILIKTY